MNTASLYVQLAAIRDEMVAAGSRGQHLVAQAHPQFTRSVLNLIHYMALRCNDLRGFQDPLASLGLSSLGRSEACTLASLDAVLSRLARDIGTTHGSASEAVGLVEGKSLLDRHTESLLGPPVGERRVRIMVTMPTEAATDPALVRTILDRGMSVMRINAAHDGPDAWSAMIRNLRAAQADTGRPARVLIDLPGPKLRTGAIEPGPAVQCFRPHRDSFGSPTAPTRLWLALCDSPAPGPADGRLVGLEPLLAHSRVGDTIEFRDSSGSRRHIQIIGVESNGFWGHALKTLWLTNGLTLRLQRAGSTICTDELRGVPSTEGVIALFPNDELIITADPAPGRAAIRDLSGRVLEPARVPCTLPRALGAVRVGEPIWLDDGKIGGRVNEVGEGFIRVVITHARPKGENLRADKGINLPDTHLDLPAISDEDDAVVRFAAANADLVGMSFAQNPDDVADLRRRLASVGADHPGIVLKIETKRGFEHLPALLLEAMKGPACGVMIARGDLAVECGYQRLAEVQEEMLWLCEAAHVPVIWATQVLEKMAKSGLPTRSEVTDAAMAQRAECVMLNKGPFMAEVITTLDDILHRMEAHQAKKRALLRPLSVARAFEPALS